MAQAVTLAALEAMPEAQRTDSLLPVDCLASGLPAIGLDAASAARILQGQRAQIDDVAATVGLVRLYDLKRRFLGLGELEGGGCLVPKRLIAVPRVAPETALGDQ